MKQIIKTYSLNTTAKTVTLTDFTTVRLDRLQLIVDTTTNSILYNFADSSVSTATVSGNVITLSTMGSAANTDTLQIIYDSLTGDPTYDTPVLPTGAATTANQTTANTTLSSIQTDVAPLVASGAGGYVRQDSNATIAKETGGNLATTATNTGNVSTATGAQADATYTTGSGSVISLLKGIFGKIAGTLTVSGSVTTSGTVTEANSATIATNTGNIPAKGAATTANSTPVNIASDQTVPVSSSTLATASAQTTANTSLSSIKTDLDSVVTNTTGASTAANQTTANTTLSTIATNTGNGATSANQTNGNQQAKLTDGTNVGSVVAGDTGFNGVAIANATKTFTFTTSTTGAQILLADTKVEGYGSVEVVYTSVGAGLALTGQFSTVAGGTYVSQSNFASGTSGFSGALGTTVGTVYTSPIRGNFFQINVTALTSGTFTGTVTLRATAPQSSGVQAAQTGTWNVGGATSAAMADAFANPTNNSVAALQGLFNGTTWDRMRDNEAVSLLASAARTTTQTSADLVNYNGASFLDIILDMTTVGTGSVTMTVNGKDTASGKYYLLLSGAAVTTNVTNVYRVGVGLTAAANSIANLPVPRTFQIVITANNANSATYSVGYNLTRGQ